MPLEAGRRLGSFEVVSLLGKGGMGEVYLAHDLKLGRKVALKVLPPTLAQDAERLKRVGREARVLASLSHPNIAALFGFEEADGLPFLVMELVPGTTLADRLRSGVATLSETLDWGRQVADALEEAHAKSVIHRDLKPANVMLTPEGRVKVLDFGLAKPLGGDASTSEDTATLAREVTSEGAVVGTAAYMSPEQARGHTLDSRTDVWSFGCVLYEMLTGRRLFGGPTPSDTLAAVLGRELDLGPLPRSTPRGVRDLVRRCLERDRRKRLQSMGDARLELEEAMAGALTASDGSEGAPSPRRRSIVAALALGLTVGAVAGRFSRGRPTPGGPWFPKRLTVPLASGAELVDHGLAVSPDGTQMVYVAVDSKSRTQLYVQALAEAGPKPVPGTDGAAYPAFSPDGRWLVYLAEGKLMKVPIGGGAPTVVCAVSYVTAPSWLRDDSIFFTDARGGAILRVSAGGGVAETFAQFDRAAGESATLERQPLPGGGFVMLTIRSTAGERIAALSLDTRQTQTILSDARWPHYVPPSHLLYARSAGPGTRERWAVAGFDSTRLRVTGPPVDVLEDLRTGGYEPRWVTPSPHGILAYIAGPAPAYNEGDRVLEWVDREGRLRPSGLPAKDLVDMSVALSPDGRRVAAAVAGDQPGTSDIWVGDLGSLVWTRLTFGGTNLGPVWSPDGGRIAFAASQGKGRDFDLYWAASDGSSDPELFLRLGAWGARPTSFSPDGQTLVYCQESTAGDPAGLQDGRIDLFAVPTQGERKPTPLLKSSFSVSYGVFSPDGRWIAYVSFESGERQVYVRAARGDGRKWAVSSGRGFGPAWAPSGRELFYQDRNTLMVVPVSTSGAGFEAGTPRKLLDIAFNVQYDMGRPYDPGSDGQRFLVLQARVSFRPEIPLRLGLIPDWLQEVEARVRSAAAR